MTLIDNGLKIIPLTLSALFSFFFQFSFCCIYHLLRVYILFIVMPSLLKKEMTIHSSILAWRIPRTEEPGGLRSPGEENGNPLQYSCLENPMDRGAWWGTVHGVSRVGHDLATKYHKQYMFDFLSICKQ